MFSLHNQKPMLHRVSEAVSRELEGTHVALFSGGGSLSVLSKLTGWWSGVCGTAEAQGSGSRSADFCKPMSRSAGTEGWWDATELSVSMFCWWGGSGMLAAASWMKVGSVFNLKPRERRLLRRFEGGGCLKEGWVRLGFTSAAVSAAGGWNKEEEKPLRLTQWTRCAYHSLFSFLDAARATLHDSQLRLILICLFLLALWLWAWSLGLWCTFSTAYCIRMLLSYLLRWSLSDFKIAENFLQQPFIPLLTLARCQRWHENNKKDIY